MAEQGLEGLSAVQDAQCLPIWASADNKISSTFDML